MTDHFPQYDESGEEILFFPNVWRDIAPQEVLGAECFINPANINNGLNRFVMDITGEDFRKMLSSLYVGSEIAYPQEFMQIIVNFLKMVHCPIDFEEECKTYPTYTPIIQYSPMSPFIDPDEVPEGYLFPPFVFVSDENIAEYTDFQVGDVIAPINSFPLDTGWFDDLNENLPSLTISVEGEGTLNINFINIPQGGLAIVTVDNPPNLIDILAGIITGADNIIDLNLDILSVPPETAQEHIYPVEVTGMGMHTVYVVFFPILDDSLIPLRFGGGLRSIELCDFGEVIVPYVEDIRYNDDPQMLQFFKAGLWHDVTDWTVLMDYIFDALDKAENAQAVNASQDVSINNIDILATEAWSKADDAQARATVLEGRADAIEADIVIINSNISTHETRLDAIDVELDSVETELGDHELRISALEDAQVNAQIWSHEFDFTTSDEGWSGGADYVSGEGFLFDADENINPSSITIRDSRITFIELHVKRVSGTNISATIQYTPTFNSQGLLVPTGVGNTAINWAQINPIPGSHSPQIKLIPAASNSFYLQKAVFWGRGTDPF